MLCSANQCRSPMAAAFLGRHLAARGVSARVGSAGRGPAGAAPPPRAVDAMAGHDLDLSGHRSASTSGSDLAAADLVVGMAREHVRDAIAIDPAVRPRAFTLKELVRLGEASGPRRDDQTVEAWLGRLDAARDPSSVLGAAKADDVTDPIGRSAQTYRRTSAELDDLTRRLAALLA